MSTDNTDLDRAEKILNDDHYGLSDVKRKSSGILISKKSDK